jgi:uncharacterized membrane protein
MITTDSSNKKFQLDRIALFSDAVFAIAITLLVIEIKVPELEHDFTDKHLLKELAHMIGRFIGFFISFFVIGRYWIGHHKMFGYVTNYSYKLLWANLYFVLTLIIMPFTSGFFSEYWSSRLFTPVVFYVVNFWLTAIANIYLWNVISNPKNKLIAEGANMGLIRFYKTRALVAPIGLSFAFIIALFSIPWAYFSPVMIFVISLIVNRIYKKKHPEYFLNNYPAL